MMGVFGLQTAKTYCLGSGVVPQKPIPLCPIGQQRCFWIPGVGLFEVHYAKKCCLGSGVAPQTTIPLYPMGQQKCFWIPMMGLLELHKAKNYRGVLGWRPKHPYRCTLLASKGCYCLGLGVGVPKAITGVGGQLNHPTPLRFASAKCLLQSFVASRPDLRPVSSSRDGTAWGDRLPLSGGRSGAPAVSRTRASLLWRGILVLPTTICHHRVRPAGVR